MTRVTIVSLVVLMFFACDNEQSTCTCYSTNNIDSISKFTVIKDSVYTDVSDEIMAYPKIDKDASNIKIASVVQVSCGYPKFSISSRYDTLILTTKNDSTKTCVDWTAKFKYHAEISVLGTCRYVRFKNFDNIKSNGLDTLLRI